MSSRSWCRNCVQGMWWSSTTWRRTWDLSVAQAIESAGACVLRLPPYSPDFTPIEQLFSKVK